MGHLLEDHSFEREALNFFPTPLADTFDEAIAQDSARFQRDRIIETVRVAIRLLGLLALSATPTPPASKTAARLIRKLMHDGLGDGEWMGLLTETVQPFAANPQRFGIPLIVSTLFYENGVPTAVFDKGGACKKLRDMRNAVAHGVSGTEESARVDLAARLPDFEIFLKALGWLTKVALVVPQAVITRTDRSLEYSAIKLIGVTPRRGFRPEKVTITEELTPYRVYAVLGNRPAVELFPFVQYAEGGNGQDEIFLFEHVSKQQVILRTYPTGDLRFNAEALCSAKAKLLVEPLEPRAPEVSWTLESLRIAARKASDDYLDKMERERVYLAHLYARRFDLEVHLSGFLDRECSKTGMLIVGTSGIGKTNTLCHIVRQWRDEPNKLKDDVVLLVGGSALPGGQFKLRDVLLDRLEISDTFQTVLSAFGAQRKNSDAQFVIVVDGIDKHPQPAELLRQLDELIVRSDALPWFKVIVSIGEVTYGTIRKSGFIPAVRDYYTVTIREAPGERESAEVLLGRLTDEELADAYDRYRHEPGLAPTSIFDSLTAEVKNAIRNPLFLRVVMEVFNARQIPRRVLTAEVLLEYCNKKIFSEPNRMFFVNRFVDLLYDKRWTSANFDALAQAGELREMVLDLSSRSPYLQLLDEQVLEEQLKRVSAILPPQRTIAFTYDRMLEYLLLNRIVERFGMGTDLICDLSQQASRYLPLRGVLTTLLLAKVDEGCFEDVAELLRSGDPEVMKVVGLDLLTELELMSPTQAETSLVELVNSSVGRLVSTLLVAPDVWVKALLLTFSDKLQKLSLYRRAGFVYEKLVPCIDENSEGSDASELQRGLGEVKHVFGQKRDALFHFEKALSLSKAAEDRAGEQAVLDAIGRVYHELGEMSLAKEYFDRSLGIDVELVKATGSVEAQRGRAQSLINLADYHSAMGEANEVIDATEKAKHIYTEIGDKRGIASALYRIGASYRRQGMAEKARQCLNEALPMHQQLGDKKSTAKDLYGLALTFHMEGRWAEALATYDQGLKIHEEIGNKEGIADMYTVMGETYRWSGALEKALEAYEKSLDVAKEMESPRGMMICLTNLGATYLFVGDATKAADFLNEALQLQKEQLGFEGIPETLSFLSAAMCQLGRLDDALAYSEAALRVLKDRQFGEEDIQLVNYYHYQILVEVGRKEEAIVALQTAYENMMEQAKEIKDSGVRHSFLNNFTLRRQIAEAWETWSIKRSEEHD
jgi:tetratricopeptide (TPR) repeat protein